MRFSSISFRQPGIHLEGGLTSIVRAKDGWDIETEGDWVLVTPPHKDSETVAVPRENVTHGTIARRKVKARAA